MEGLERFFLAPVDPTSLAVFRIVIGAITILNAASYARTARWLLHPNGMVPFDVWHERPGRRQFSLLRWLPASRHSVSFVVLVYALAGACLSLGLWTREAAAVAFLTGVSLNHRNPHALHSGDAVLRVLTFLTIFSDAGRALSIDAVLAGGDTTRVTAWPLRLMQIQLATLYLHAVRFKLRGRTWRDGTATHYAANLLAHRKRRLPAALDGVTAHRIATYGTLGVELAGGTLVWLASTRLVTVAGLGALHLTLQLLMHMHLFQWIMVTSLILFVPGETLASWIGTS